MESCAETEPTFPASWGERRDLVEKINLGDITPLSEWAGVIAGLIKIGWASPTKLATASPELISAALPDGQEKLLSLQLWKASTLIWTASSSSAWAKVNYITDTSDQLIARMKKAPLCRSAASDEVKLSFSTEPTKKSFPKMVPTAKLRTLSNANLEQFQMGRFFRTAAQDLALTGIHRTFPSFASGIRRYYKFCELKGCPPFPVTERIMLERASVFNETGCFSNYVGYMRKVCFFLEESLSWDTDALKNTVAALKLRGAGMYRFPNFIRSDLVIEILIHDSLDSSFAQLCYISFLLALRVPSEALKLRRCFKHDDLTHFSPMKEEPLIGLRWPTGNTKLVVRLSRRKNLSQGCIMSRPCFCELSQSKASRLCRRIPCGPP